MTKTIRINDEDLQYVREHQKEGENDQVTLKRLLHTPVLPTATGGNQIDYARIERIVKNALESALAR